MHNKAERRCGIFGTIAIRNIDGSRAEIIADAESEDSEQLVVVVGSLQSSEGCLGVIDKVCIVFWEDFIETIELSPTIVYILLQLDERL